MKEVGTVSSVLSRDDVWSKKEFFTAEGLVDC